MVAIALTMQPTPAVLAHAGGWDEALFVLVPIAIFAGLLALANRRAAASGSVDEEPAGEPGDAQHPGG